MQRLLGVMVVVAGGGPALGQDKGHEPSPADIMTAWQKAGARPGWMRPDTLGVPQFRAGDEGKAGEVVAFRFDEWKSGLLDGLPAPRQPFGLDLGYTTVTDAGL